VISVIASNDTELIAKSHEFRAAIPSKKLSVSQRKKDESVEAFLKRKQVKEDEPIWARLMGNIASKSIESCRDAVAHAWKLLCPRITTLYPIMEAGTLFLLELFYNSQLISNSKFLKK